MPALTRDQLLDLKNVVAVVKVELPEFGQGAYVAVRSMTAGEALAYAAADEIRQKAITLSDTPGDIRVEGMARLIELTAVDDEGKPAFQAGDWETIAQWPNSALNRVALAAMRLNGGADLGNLRATGDDVSSIA